MSDCSCITSTPEETRELGEIIAGCCSGGEVFLLEGDLGAGKTCLTQGLGKGLGVEEDVTSPTFVLHCQYEGRFELNHIDAYRLEGVENVASLGFEDFYGDKRIVTVIEWPQMMGDVLPEAAIVVEINSDGKTDRNFKLRASDRKYHAFMDSLREELRARKKFIK